MSKKMTVEIDGKQIELLFIGRFYNIFKEATGFDLLDSSTNFSSVKMNQTVQGIVYAGYVTNEIKNKREPALSKEWIFEAVLNEDTAHIYNEYAKVVNPKAAEELEELGKKNGQLEERSISNS